MLDHLSIPVSDFEASKAFYLSALSPLGYELITDKPEFAGFGLRHDGDQNIDPGGSFWIFQGDPTLPRIHIAFSAATHAQVAAFFTQGRNAGGRENGAPGIRAHYHPTYYAAFLLDPDGYNIEAVCHLAL